MRESMMNSINPQDLGLTTDTQSPERVEVENQAELRALALKSFIAHQDEHGQEKSSMVWTGRDAAGSMVQFKTMRERDLERNSLAKQYDLHQQFQQAGVRVPALKGYIDNLSGQESEPKEVIATAAVNGRTLEEELRYRAATGLSFFPEELQAILDDASQQVKRAHQARLYHRDLDLRNVMLDQDGHIVFLDFGRAKKAMSSEDELDLYGDKVTRGGKAVTAGYLHDEAFISKFAKRVQELGLLKRAA